MKCIDVWMVTCLIFNIYSLVSFGVQIKLHSLAEAKRSKASTSVTPITFMQRSASEEKLTEKEEKLKLPTWDYDGIAYKIDAVSLYLYPASFLSFSVIYWLAYLYSSGRLH